MGHIFKATCLFFVCQLFIYNASVAQTTPEDSLNWDKQIDGYVAETMADWSILGLALTVVENNRVLFLKGYGVTNIDSREPVDPETTVFHVASVSKPVTAMAVLQLLDGGQLSLDDPVNALLPNLKLENLFDNYPTLREVLVHTGGFDIQNINRMARSAAELNSFEEYLNSNMPPVIYPPGSISVYSNHGYALLGSVIGEVSGRRYADYMNEYIFKPLGMNRSSFEVESPINRHLATGYGFGPNEGNETGPVFIKTVPASMMKTTAGDMANWMRAVLNNGSFNENEILKPGSAKAMLTQQYSHHPLLPGRSYGLSEGSRFSPPEFLHSGAVPGYTSALVLVPEKEFGVFVTVNSNAYLWGIVNKVLDHLEPSADSAKADMPKIVLDDTSEFEGYYRAAGIPQTSMFKFGNWIQQTQITALGNGQVQWGGNQYQAVDSLAFQKIEGESILAFMKVDGEVEYLFAGGDEYVRVPWFENRIFQGSLLIIFLFTFLVVSIGWGVVPFFRSKMQANEPKWPVSLAVCASLLNLIFLGSVIYLAAAELGNQNILSYGIPVWFIMVKVLIWISFALVIGCFGSVILSWKNQYWQRGKQVRYSLAVLILLLFIPYVLYWNLLG